MFRTKIRTVVVLLAAVFAAPATAQQFVTDDYFVMPHKSSNLMIAAGENYTAIIPSMGLFPNWEIFVGGTLTYESSDRTDENHFSPMIIAKNKVWENDRQTGGLAWTVGTGLNPNYLKEDVQVDGFEDVYGVLNWTIPFANDAIQFDLNPGFSANYGNAFDGTAWNFTYAARIAWIKGLGNWSPVAEVFGAEGDAGSDPQYKAGLRWEPNDNFRFAVTYGGGFGDHDGAGLEVGVILVTVPCKEGCTPFWN